MKTAATFVFSALIHIQAKKILSLTDWDKLVKFFKEYNEKVFIEKDRITTGNYLETTFYKGNTFKDVGYIDFGFDNIYRNISHKDMLKLAKILFKYDKVS